MAKRINFKRSQQSSNGGFRTFPGSGGSFSSETPDITDTILGQTFESVERGLIDWRVSTDGIYKGYPGYNCRISRGGTPTALSDEPVTALNGGSTIKKTVAGTERDLYGFQITAPAKRILDRTASFSLKTAGSAKIVLIDYLDGRFFLDLSRTADQAAITGKYLPLMAVARATDYTLTMSVNMREETNFVESDANANDGVIAFPGTGANVTFTGRGGFATAGLKFAITEASATDEWDIAYAESSDTINMKWPSTTANKRTAAKLVEAFKAKTGAPFDLIQAEVKTTGTIAASAVSAAAWDTAPKGYPGPANLKDPDGRGGYMLYSPGLRNVSLSLSGVTIPERKFSDTLDIRQALRDREEYLIEINPDGLQAVSSTAANNGLAIRSWFRLASGSEEGDVGQTQTTSIDFSLSVPYDEKLERTIAVTGNTGRLPGPVLDALNSWIYEEWQNEVQYLPSGKADGTGIQGKVVVSDVSLSGGLSSMNSFSIELMGNGQYIDI